MVFPNPHCSLSREEAEGLAVAKAKKHIKSLSDSKIEEYIDTEFTNYNITYEL